VWSPPQGLTRGLRAKGAGYERSARVVEPAKAYGVKLSGMIRVGSSEKPSPRSIYFILLLSGGCGGRFELLRLEEGIIIRVRCSSANRGARMDVAHSQLQFAESKMIRVTTIRF